MSNMPIQVQFTSLQAAVTEIQSNQVCLVRVWHVAPTAAPLINRRKLHNSS